MTAVTHPYFDPLGAGFIVSVSHTVTLPAAINNSHKVYAVMGGDLTISSFGASVLKTMGPKCIKNGKLQCFLMDTSGYIVYHPNFENVYNDSSKVCMGSFSSIIPRNCLVFRFLHENWAVSTRALIIG